MSSGGERRERERLGSWGWLGCFAARNTLHYTVGVVYKRLFFFSLASCYPLPLFHRHTALLCHPFLPRVYLSFSFPSFSSGGRADMPASLWDRIEGMGIAGGNVQDSLGWLVSSFFPFLLLLLFFLRNYRKLVPWRGRFVIRLILSRERCVRERDGELERGERRIDVGWEYKRQTSSRLVHECFNLGGTWGEEKAFSF